ncbi:MAG: pyrimidine-nucleoside phosphorylase, partial [Eubacterium sp.]|nr:pyrimidine-nucleoside phosphorylase [Eubacterium sp.]
MNIIEIIEKKKRGFKLSQEEIQFFVDGYVGGDVTDYQASALLMAICINGMDFEETFNLTMAMRNSGDIVEIPGYDRVLLDKHSTGGVGDKSTLVLAPILAAMDIPVFKMSGRG